MYSELFLWKFKAQYVKVDGIKADQVVPVARLSKFDKDALVTSS
jgi:hypothetical protein